MNDVTVIVRDLPTTVKGFVFKDCNSCPCIVLNARMPVEIQRQTYHHEMKHITSGDIDNKYYREYSA